MSGKRIEDLKLRDEGDPRDTEWYRFSKDIEDLLSTGEYTWAEDTLRDIQLTVEQTQHVTDRQRQAVDNIEAARRDQPEPRRGGSRRYEGFHKRSR